MNYDFKTVYTHFAQSIVSHGLPKSGATFMPIVAFCETSNGSITGLNILDQAESFFRSPLTHAKFLKFIEASMKSIESDKDMLKKRCLVVASETMVKIGTATSEDEIAAASERMMTEDIKPTRAVVITIYRPEKALAGVIPISSKRILMYDPHGELAIMYSRNSMDDPDRPPGN